MTASHRLPALLPRPITDTDRMLAALERPLTVAQVCEALDLDRATVASRLAKLCLSGRATRSRASSQHPYRYALTQRGDS